MHKHRLTARTCTLARSQVVRCTMENSVSVAKTFLLADVIVTEIPEAEPAAAAGPAGDYDY
eukprot:scaffold3497_cov15-Tisochrysis_lutea.AAC.1